MPGSYFKEYEIDPKDVLAKETSRDSPKGPRLECALAGETTGETTVSAAPMGSLKDLPTLLEQNPPTPRWAKFKDKIVKNSRRIFGVRKHSGAGMNVSLLRLTRNALPYYFSKKGHAYYPLTIFFTINGRCNLLCEMCDVGQKNRESMFYENLIGDGSDFDPKKYKEIIDEVKFFKPFIGITTTEPLIYRPLEEIIEYTVRSGLGINITSNGINLERRAEGIVNSGLTRLSISIDGPREFHDLQRGVKGTYDRAMRGIQKVHELKKNKNVSRPEIYLNTAITNLNYSKLIEMLEKLPLDIVNQVNMKLMVFSTEEIAKQHNALWGKKYYSTEHCLAGIADYSKIDIKLLYEQAQEIQRRFSGKVMLHFDVDKEKLIRYFTRPHEFMDDTNCVLPWFIAQINNRADLICYTRCYASTYGNLYKKSFLELWNDEPIRAFRKDLQKHGRFTACSRCDGVLYR